jgi:hypothetical protein
MILRRYFYGVSGGFASLLYLWSLCLSLGTIVFMYHTTSVLHTSFLELDGSGSQHQHRYSNAQMFRSTLAPMPPRVDYSASFGLATESPLICDLIEQGFKITPIGRCHE